MKIKLSLVAVCFISFFTSTAYSQELYADNINFNKRIHLVDSVNFLNQMDEADEFLFPELDLEEDWNTERVNPYKVDISKIPDSVKINVSQFAMPTAKATHITSNFGYRPRFRRFHYGTDLKVRTGDTICAAFDGKIRVRRFERGGYGYFLVIRHSNGLETLYAHLSRFLVNIGDEVKAGQPIGLGGNTGRSYGSHLHFETRFLGKAIDPREIFDFERNDVLNDTYVYNVRSSKSSNSNMLAKATNTAPPKGEQDGITYHRIKQGDTLGKIAKRNGVTINQLCKLNGLTTKSVLKIGQVIRCS